MWTLAGGLDLHTSGQLVLRIPPLGVSPRQRRTVQDPIARTGAAQLNDKLNEIIADLRVIKGDAFATRLGQAAMDQKLDTFIAEQCKTHATVVMQLSEPVGKRSE